MLTLPVLLLSLPKINRPQTVLAQLNDGIPDYFEVFTDLDLFIEKELSEVNVNKRVGRKLEENYDDGDWTQLKDEYSKDKQQYQKQLDKRVKQHQRHNTKFAPIDEEDEDDDEMSLLDLTIRSRMERLRIKKIQKLKLEVVKQEFLLAKINQVLERIRTVNEQNVADVVKIERHYLVASARFQSALTELRRLTESTETLHPRPLHYQGNCVIDDIMLEVKSNYFKRRSQSHNEFLVAVLKYEDKVFASKAVAITNDVRIVKFPDEFRVPDAFTDFSMRLELYGTTFWRQHSGIRETMLRKYGFITFTLADTSGKRERFDMIEVITSERKPLRQKILMTIRQDITVNIHHNGALMVKLGDDWHKTRAVLCGHLLALNLVGTEEADPMLLDLHNIDTDFLIPVVSRVSQRPHTFLFKFNHYVDGNEFFLMLAAETAQDYSQWVSSINKSLALLK